MEARVGDRPGDGARRRTHRDQEPEHVCQLRGGPSSFADVPPGMPVSNPDARIVFGMLLIVAGLIGWMTPDLGRVFYWMILFMAGGATMIVSGAAQLRRQAGVQKEVARAKWEWRELVRGAAEARAAGEGVARFLQQRGYRDFFVRRWLVRRLERAR